MNARFFGAVVAATIIIVAVGVGGWLLTLGIFVGEGVQLDHRGNGAAVYFHTCRYLYATGIREMIYPPVVYNAPQEASAHQFCAPLGNGNYGT
jgi:phosphotransferase system  glucose/maltose/N-acetylglucosamine-specific IIC component